MAAPVTVTNDTLRSALRQWKDQSYPWSAASGTWANPYNFINDQLS